MNPVRSSVLAVVALVALVACQPVVPPTPQNRHVRPGDDVAAVLESLRPGDEVWIHSGAYALTRRVSIRTAGTAERPVVVRSAPGEPISHLYRPASASAQNTINIEGASYLTISSLEISSNGGDGIKIYAPGTVTRGLVFEHLYVHDVDTGFNSKSPVDGIAIRANRIERTGTGGTGDGMYLGCHDGSCPLSNSLIERNLIGATIDGNETGYGIQVKAGSYGNVITRNVIHGHPYPCIIVYSTLGRSRAQRNVIDGNWMWDCRESGVQAEADAIIRNNVIFDAAYPLNSHRHVGAVAPSNLTVVHNTFAGGAGGSCLSLSWTGGQANTFAGNLVQCDTDSLSVQGIGAAWGNVVSVPSGVATGFDPNLNRLLVGAVVLADRAGHNALPSAAGTFVVSPAVGDVPLDADRWPRPVGAHAGAYQGGRPSPSWTPIEAVPPA